MFTKLVNVHVLPRFSGCPPPKPHAQTEPSSSSALKIIHAGGNAEYHYMAVPAKRIIDKYPSFTLAKPDVFKRPWESVVHPDRILKPGEKFYLIPHRAMKNLLRKTRKPNNEDVSTTSFASNDSSSCCISEASGSMRSAFKKKSSSTKKQVRFVGIDNIKPLKVHDKDSTKRVNNDAQAQGMKGRSRRGVAWQPKLNKISEKNDE